MKLRKPILLTLIGLGLCAIGVSVYLQYGKPYLREMEVQSQDEKRIADLDALNTSIQAILTASSTVNIGNANAVYISLPSATSTCADLALPSLPDGWSYHCATSADLPKTDGTGWLPAALDIATLPIDPLNNADTLNYYAFVTSPAGWEAASSTLQLRSGQATSTAPSNSSRPSQNATEDTAGQATTTVTVATSTQYVLTAVLDSKKYLTEKAQTDEGTDPIRYVLGARDLWSESLGLVAFWRFEQQIAGGSTKFDDSSGNGNVAQAFSLTPTNGVLGSQAVALNGQDSRIQIANSKTLDISKSISLLVWVKPGALNLRQRYMMKSTVYDLNQSENNVIGFGIYNPESIGAAGVSFPLPKDALGKWHMVVGTWDDAAKKIAIYYDGNLMNEEQMATSTQMLSSSGSLALGSWNTDNKFIGALDDVAIYDRSLSVNEIKKIWVTGSE